MLVLNPSDDVTIIPDKPNEGKKTGVTAEDSDATEMKDSTDKRAESFVSWRKT